MAELTHHRFRSAEPQENADQWMAETGMSFEDMLEQAFEDYFDTWSGSGGCCSNVQTSSIADG